MDGLYATVGGLALRPVPAPFARLWGAGSLSANLMGNCDLVQFHLTGHHLMIDLEVGVEVNLHHCAHRGDISLSCSAMCA